MSSSHSSSFERLAIKWVDIIEKNRIGIIIAVILLTLSSIFYIKNNLSMSTSTADMLSEELPWRKLDIEYEKQFPQFLDNLLIVIESNTPDQASDTAKKLFTALENEPTLINELYYPALLPYFRQSAFLFLEEEELQDLADQLATIQPFLGTLLQDKNLRGLFTMLGDALEAKQDGEDIDLKPLLLEINRTLEDSDYQISWQHLMSNEKESKSIYREFIVLQTLEAEDELLPGEKVMAHVRGVISKTGLDDNSNIRIRLTGGTALSYEELKSVSDANIRAIVISFILVAIILSVGLGSAWLVFSCLMTLFSGLIATTGFAALTVGELNLISVAFAVLYIGLGIDFAIHLALRYREEIALSENNENVLQLTLRHIFRSLILCAITTAIGFYSFIPTDYEGVAELGWIAGSGMFISILFTLTLLPALLSLRKNSVKANKRNFKDFVLIQFLSSLPYQYSKLILIVTALITIGIATQINKINFDTNTLNLQAPENESVQTYRDLLNDTETSPWRIVLLKQKNDSIEAIKKQLEAQALVDKVVWFEDLLPTEQEEKLFIIDEMNLFMGPLESEKNNINNKERSESISDLKNKLHAYPGDDLKPEIMKLEQNLNQLLNSSPDAVQLESIEARMLKSLDGRLKSLSDALDAEEIQLEDIPTQVSSRWMNNEFYKMEVYPKENLNDNDAMKRFVKQLQAYDDEVIGSPVISIEAGEAVITAFKSAFSYALFAIAVLLLVLIPIKKDAAIILVSVLVGAMFTAGLMLLFNIPLNFANIIGLPLLLGIGVDSGIHIADRFRQEQHTNKNIFMTSSSRGVIVSSLTTICSISNLAFSAHAGTASMGILLTTGLAAMMISTMLILPAFLVWQRSLEERINVHG